MNSNIDPRLKAALKEIERVMDKHDCGGIISLHSRTHTEFKFHVPNWALFRFLKGPDKDLSKLHIKHRGVTDMDSTVSTYHLLFDAQEVCARFFQMFDAIGARLKAVGIDIERTNFDQRQ